MTIREPRRKTPEDFLRECQAEEAVAKKGHLKIFLGYASGVGKSFRMLDEARRRRERGQDVVVGAVQRHVPPEVEPILRKLEVIALKAAPGGTAVDVEAIIARHPSVCVIDGLAYNNPPGLRNATRWQDVKDLIDAGISVIASINIQYVAELREQVEAVTGKQVDQIVPLAFIQGADEIEIVDAAPVEPREHSADEQLQVRRYEERLSSTQHPGAHERILVCITPRANMEEMMTTAQIVAKRFHGDLIVAYVKQSSISPQDQSALDAKLAIANAAGAHIEVLEGSDPADALLEFARSRGITQLFVGHSQRAGLARLRGSPLDRLIWEGHGMDVCVFPQ
jgi:two-component system sensor histidine kinase KdpD